MLYCFLENFHFYCQGKETNALKLSEERKWCCIPRLLVNSDNSRQSVLMKYGKTFWLLHFTLSRKINGFIGFSSLWER